MDVAKKSDRSARGRAVALFVAGVGIYWLIALQIGVQYGLSQRTRALLDLIALGGFAYGMWLAYGLWRSRDKDED